MNLVLARRWRQILLIAALVSSGGEIVAADVQVPAGRRQLPEIKIDGAEIDRSTRYPVASFADALDPIQHAVVSVHSSKIIRPRRPRFDDRVLRGLFGRSSETEPRRQSGLGSGVIVSTDGYILTNNHVISGFDEIRVALPDGREVEAEVVGGDPRTDVAVVKVDLEDLPAATLANSDQLRVGDIVFAVGNPMGVGQTTTMGIVSATGRSSLSLIEQGYQDFIQTDAPINFGNSGGALVDAQGRVVGINTAIISNSQGNIGIGLAIPVNLASTIMRNLIEEGEVSRGYLGVKTQNIDDPALAEEFGLPGVGGVVIVGVVEGSSADRAGLRYGDVLLELNGRKVDNGDALRVRISLTPPDTEVAILLVREGQRLTVPAILGRLDEETDFSAGAGNEILGGVNVSQLTSGLRRQFEIPREVSGLIVTEVDPDSRYLDVLPVGTVIAQINRRPATDLSAARAALIRGRNLVFVYQSGAYRYALITVN